MASGLSRRELLAAGAAAAAALGLPGPAAGKRRRREWTAGLEFGGLGDGDGWPGWACPGVANVRRSGGLGVLEAASDVFPCDPRPVAFALDTRARDCEIAALVEASGAGAGVVTRRTGPRDYYAAIYDDERRALVLVRRTPEGVVELASAPVLASAPFRLWLRAEGRHPTMLSATLEAQGAAPVGVSASDDAPRLQRAGDPGVLATARTLFPHSGPAVLPALGNLHLLPWGVQEGQAFMQTPVGREVIGAIAERSTARFREIAISASGRRRTTAPSIVAASSARPVRRGAVLRVATDVPATVEIEVSHRADFRDARRLRPRATDSFDAVLTRAGRLTPGRRVHWRVRARRGRRVTVGPARSFRVLPRPGSPAPVTLAIGSCASQFGPLFDLVAQREPDVLVWQGDLNYPDTIGPLAQTVPAYAGIWRDFLANPRMAAIIDRAHFAVQRDDHDYGVQDANSTNLVPWGLAPWESLMERRRFYRFAAGRAEVWVLDQRYEKTDPAAPDTPQKTLLGGAQREWLLRTLARSRAPYKIVCSPCTLAPLPANARDGSWAGGYTAERDLLLAHVAEHVSGRTVFVTGDTHWTMAYEDDRLFEARACPLGIPTPNDITLTDPQAAEEARSQPGVLYADDTHNHVALLRVSGAGLELELLREDGTAGFSRAF